MKTVCKIKTVFPRKKRKQKWLKVDACSSMIFSMYYVPTSHILVSNNRTQFTYIKSLKTNMLKLFSCSPAQRLSFHNFPLSPWNFRWEIKTARKLLQNPQLPRCPWKSILQLVLGWMKKTMASHTGSCLIMKSFKYAYVFAAMQMGRWLRDVVLAQTSFAFSYLWLFW